MKKTNLLNALIAFSIFFFSTLSCTTKEKEDMETIVLPQKSMNYSINSIKYTIEYSDGSTKAEMHESENPNYQWYIEKKDGNGVVLEAYYASIVSEILTLYQNDVAVYSHSIDPMENPPVQAPWPGNCNELGGKRQGETFEDCFARNFTNFCCDFTGCTALTLYPIPVMAGIALGCGTSGAWIPHIENIYDHENNTYIY